MRPYACMNLGAGSHSNAVRHHACMRVALSVGVCGHCWLKARWRKNSPSSRMGARGGQPSRGGRSGASRNWPLEVRLAETADYLLRAVLGVAPRPHWGPLWLLPATRDELVAYLRAVAGAPEADPKSELSE